MDAPLEQVEHRAAGRRVADRLERQHDRLAVAARHGGALADRLEEHDPSGSVGAGQLEAALPVRQRRRVHAAQNEELFEVVARGSEHLDALTASREGAILLGAHVGSFEAMRARGSSRGHDIHVLAYLDNAKKINTVLAEIDPAMQARVIELGGVDAILRAKEVVEAGGLVAMLGDRVGLNDKTLTVPFLGGEAPFPTGPFLLASALRCPVYLVFGVYLEGARYQLWCERFSDRVELPRASREAALRGYVERYAARLEEVARAHPFNWFNLYDFWSAPPTRDGQVAGPESVN